MAEEAPSEAIEETVTEAKNDGFDMCIDVTCVDYLQQPGRELDRAPVSLAAD